MLSFPLLHDSDSKAFSHCSAADALLNSDPIHFYPYLAMLHDSLNNY